MSSASANKIADMRFTVAMDNHEPPRRIESVTAEMWQMADGEPSIRIPRAAETFRGARDAVYLLDDGATVVPYYVAGWNDRRDTGEVFLRPFPVNRDGRTRPDNGRPVDYSTWSLGPSRAYHLKITTA